MHDPIYQGAGAYGQAGVPRPKAGAVTKAHGGVLILDEIGELAPVQMNKLLKVLEDGKVFFESAYYAVDDAAIPAYIHKIFKEGMPADFRLIGATTRRPEEIPPALRSRCMEIYFDPLGAADIEKIAKNAMAKVGLDHEAGAARLVCQYAQNGRDAVNIVQTAASLASLEKRDTITIGDICWVADCGKYAKHVSRPREQTPQIGAVCGLAVDAGGAGRLMDIEACCRPGTGRLFVTGIVEEEELETGHGRLRRKGTARSSAETALALLDRLGLADVKHSDFYVNFPGGVPVDGPSAGTAVFTALYSAATGCAVPGNLAMTGEITLSGRVLAVGGVGQKLAAAASCGVKTVFIPKDNDQVDFHQMGHVGNGGYRCGGNFGGGVWRKRGKNRRLCPGLWHAASCHRRPGRKFCLKKGQEPCIIV